MKYYFGIIIGFVLWLCNSSCNDFLDVPPTTNVTIPSTADDYQDMLYPLSAEYSADAIIGVMGDEVYWSNNFYLNQSTDICVRRTYLYEDEVFDLTIIPSAWTTPYSLIFTYNKIINEVRHLSGEPMGRLLKIEAEAHFYRAIQYFHLASMFTPPYAMTTESTPGIPVISENDVSNTTHPRTPVQKVYRHILSDIDSAIKYLPAYPDLMSRYLASKAGAYGLKARVYFNMNQYAKALETIEKLFELLETEKSALGLEYKLTDYNQLALKNENEPWQGMDPAKDFPRFSREELKNVESLLTSRLMLRDPTAGSVAAVPFNPIFVSGHLLSFFTEEGDLRKKFMLHERNANGTYWDMEAPGLKLKRFNYSNAGVSMPDIYLMAAECYARNNDVTHALKFLNELRKNRITPNHYKELESQDAVQILKWVLEERIREFIATGHRWYDMRRLWNDPVGSPMIQKVRELNGQFYPLTQERLTIRIPEYVMQFHSDWQQNP